MNDSEIKESLKKIGIVPVVVLDDAKDAKPLADALCRGGLPCAEVTFRTAAAEESIKIMKKEHPEMLIGAGTVLTREQVDRAVSAGAEFIVSPGLNPDTVIVLRKVLRLHREHRHLARWSLQCHSDLIL